MARTRKARKATTGRGSPEAIEKRRVARKLNDLLTGGSKTTSKLDGRTEKRRQRLVKELKDGKRGKPLKPIQVLLHANELLEIGETFGSLKRQGVKPRKIEMTPEVEEYVAKTQEVYNFQASAWRLLGITLSTTLPSKTKAKRGKKGARASG